MTVLKRMTNTLHPTSKGTDLTYSLENFNAESKRR